MRRYRLAVGLVAVWLAFPRAAAAEAIPVTPDCERVETDWEPQEVEAWKGICRHGEAEVSKVASGLDLPKLGAAEAAKIVLKPQFIKTILTQSPYRDYVRGRGLVIRGAVFEKPLVLTDISVDGSVSFLDCRFGQRVDIRRSHFSQSVSFVGSVLEGGIDARAASTGGSLLLGGSDERWPESPLRKVPLQSVEAGAAKIGAALNLRDAEIPGALGLFGIRIEGGLNITRVHMREVVLSASEIRGQLAIIESVLRPRPAEVDKGGALYALLNLNFVHASQDVFLSRTQVYGPIQLDGADIGGGLFMAGGKFGAMSLRRATIKGAFTVGYNVRPTGQQAGVTSWLPDASLDLTNASIGNLSTHASLSYWPSSLVLTNFKIGSFDFGLAGAPGAVAETRRGWFEKWLGLQSAFQPYSHVRTVLVAAGDDTLAADVGYAGRDRELAHSLANCEFLNAIYLGFSKILIGYGYQMWLPILWMTVIVAVGAMIFRRDGEAKKDIKSGPDAAFYSADMFLPLLQLRKSHADVGLEDRTRYYLYFHKVAGWVIGSFLVAGLSGFTK